MIRTSKISSVDNEFSIFNPNGDLVFDNNAQLRSTSNSVRANSWTVMIVDDEPEIHQVTKLALRRFQFEEGSLNFISAYSGEEAKRLIQAHPETAIILLDIVMEDNLSGLDVVRHIRNVMENNLVRIILRTGQPGQAPEEAIILNYDINDYKTKTELTRDKLFSTVVGALRSYRDMTTIEANRKELETLNIDLEQRRLELEKKNLQLQQEMAERKKLEEVRLEKERLRIKNEVLQQQANDLVELNAAKDKFFSIVSHDLRSPFNVVLGASRFLHKDLDELTRADIFELSQSIYNSAQATYNLLENLLVWAKMQMDGVEYLPLQNNLKGLTDKTVRLFERVAAEKRIQIHNLVGADIDVHADGNMLDTVIRNLISNALKFTPTDGEVTISAQRAKLSSIAQEGSQSHPANMVEIWIADTGVGISPEDVKKLFALDAHYTTFGTADERGSGLGLLICQEMVEKNGGQIWIESEIGQGATVKFTLRVNEPAHIC